MVHSDSHIHHPAAENTHKSIKSVSFCHKTVPDRYTVPWTFMFWGVVFRDSCLHQEPQDGRLKKPVFSFGLGTLLTISAVYRIISHLTVRLFIGFRLISAEFGISYLLGPFYVLDEPNYHRQLKWTLSKPQTVTGVLLKQSLSALAVPPRQHVGGISIWETYQHWVQPCGMRLMLRDKQSSSYLSLSLSLTDDQCVSCHIAATCRSLEYCHH